MSTSYPFAYDTFTVPAGGSLTSSPHHANLHRDLGDAVTALELALGLTPYGAYGSVSARIAALEGAGFGIGQAVASGTVGSLLFVGAGALLAQDNANLFWDDSTKRLGIGDAAPAAALHVDSNAADTVAIARFANTAGDVDLFRVDVSPEAVVTASIGDLAIDGTGGTLYLKTSGSATNTGWSAIATRTGTFYGARRTGLGDTDYAFVGDGDADTGIVFDEWGIGANTLSIFLGGTQAAYFGSSRLVSGGLGGANLYFGTGSASLPQFTGTGDTATGFFIDTVAGVATSGVARQTWSGTATVINDNAVDVDLRVEGTTRPNLLYVDAGLNRVGINRGAAAHGATLDVDNLAIAESIFIARDNGTAVFTIADGGTVTATGQLILSGTTNHQINSGVTINSSASASGNVFVLNDAGGTMFSCDVSATNLGTSGAVGIGTSTGIHGLDVRTSFGFNRTAVADAAHSVGETDCIIAYTSLTASRTVTLQAASGRAGRVVVVKDESGSASALNQIVIDGNGAETIDGAASVSIATAYGSRMLYCNGSAWFSC